MVNGKIGSWDTPKTIEAYAREYSSNHEYSLHGVMNLDGSNTGNDNPRSIHQPRIEIQAIGRAVEPASAADFKIQRVNTLSSEPDNGSVLLYDSGKKEWTASGTRMEDQDIRLLSDLAVRVGHEHTASSIYNDSDEYYEPHHAFSYTSNHYKSPWASAGSNYNTTSGAYTGSCLLYTSDAADE